MEMADIGRTIGETLIDSGCRRIILSGKSLFTLDSTREHLLNRYPEVDIRICKCTADTFPNVEQAVLEAASFYGTFNYVINCQSLSRASARPTADTSLDDFQEFLEISSREVVEFTTVLKEKHLSLTILQLWMFCKAQISYFTSDSTCRASIVNIIPYGNIGTHAGHPLQAISSYSAVGMTKSVAQDLLHAHRIRLNAVCPGLTNGAMDKALPSAERLKRGDGVGRLIDMREVANVAVFMVGENASAIHGVVLPVDAGRCLTHN